jgi:hypothetical protein
MKDQIIKLLGMILGMIQPNLGNKGPLPYIVEIQELQLIHLQYQAQ